METNQIYVEPCLETLKKMPDNFLDCVITSPPYWQLRDYGYEGQKSMLIVFPSLTERKPSSRKVFGKSTQKQTTTILHLFRWYLHQIVSWQQRMKMTLFTTHTWEAEQPQWLAWNTEESI